MSTTPVLPKPFDPVAYIAERNAQAQAAKPESKPVPAVPEAKLEVVPAETAPKEDHDEAGKVHGNRRERRLAQQLGEERGRRLALEEMIAKGVVKSEQAAPAADDPEPQRAQFADEATYNRALGRWDARQESKKVTTETLQNSEAMETLKTSLREAAEKADADRKNFSDWDAVAKEAEDDDRMNFDTTKHSALLYLLATSDQKAALHYYFAKNPDKFVEFKDLSGKPALVEKFRRLEGKVELMYARPKAAEASEETPEDRKAPEKPAKGVAAAQRDLGKPKPSAEVAARGGSPVPDEPVIGSRAWMERRNQATGGR
jgi:hypothetical protein